MGDMLGRAAAVNQWVNNSAVLLKCEKMTKYWLFLATVILFLFVFIFLQQGAKSG